MDYHDPETQDVMQQVNGAGCMEGAIITGLITAIIFMAAMGYIVYSYETMIASMIGG